MTCDFGWCEHAQAGDCMGCMAGPGDVCPARPARSLADEARLSDGDHLEALPVEVPAAPCKGPGPKVEPVPGLTGLDHRNPSPGAREAGSRSAMCLRHPKMRSLLQPVAVRAEMALRTAGGQGTRSRVNPENPRPGKGPTKGADPKAINARCGRFGCGHLLTMHDAAGCALAECSCHEAVPSVVVLPEIPTPGGVPCLVEGVQLVNRTGLASLKLTAAVALDADGRAVLTVAVGMAS